MLYLIKTALSTSCVNDKKVPKTLEKSRKIPFDFIFKSDYNEYYTVFKGGISTL